jgi:protein-S-isoprenylcysteine O-methyltransferase Ste14
VNQKPDRVDAFKSEIEGLKLRGAGAEGERRLLWLGGIAVVAGLVLTVVAGIQVTNNTGPADQRAFMATGTFLGIALIIAGAALFVRYSLSRYLRFWLIRLVHESRANTDRIVDAIERSGGRPGPS